MKWIEASVADTLQAPDDDFRKTARVSFWSGAIMMVIGAVMGLSGLILADSRGMALGFLSLMVGMVALMRVEMYVVARRLAQSAA